jgi:hypothetical protein
MPNNLRQVYYKNISLKAFSLSMIVVVFGSCTKIKSTDIGTDLLPAIDKVTTFDTLLPVVTDNFLFGDSALPVIGKDFQGRAVEHVLGSVTNDPMFGSTEASIFMELKPPAYRYYFENVKDSLTLDSVVLCLKWNRTWGDTNTLQKLNVYELSEQIRNDTSYTSSAAFNYSTLLGSRSFAPKILDDSVYLFRQTLARQLRIKLSDAFGKKLLTADSANGQPYASDSLFRAFFKGLAIVPESAGASGNALMGFALSDTNTHLVLHYKAQKNGKIDTLNKKFSFDNVFIGGNANRIIRKTTGSEMAKHLTQTAGGDSLLYMQSSPGSYATIRMPSLSGFKAAKGNVMIHLAELVMEQVADPASMVEPFLTVPNVLYLDYLDTTAKKQKPFLQDALPAGQFDPLVFGGLATDMTSPSGQKISGYRLYITRYVQNIITRNAANFPLYLYAPYTVSYTDLFIGFSVNRLAEGRVRIGGGTHSKQRMRLRLVYTKI